MQYHDYHLASYAVSEFGTLIVLDLVYDYPGMPNRESHIEFTEVALYHFDHTSGAIIAEITPIPIAQILDDHADQIAEWAQRQGVHGWEGTLEGYRMKLEASGLHAWIIASAIGFHGFVIAKEMKQKDTPQKV